MAAPSPPLAGRLASLDAYRGFIMLAMVSGGLGTTKLMGDPHFGKIAYQLEHVKWEGCTFWDLIQPSFMFMVGVAMPFAFAKRREAGESWMRQFLHVIKRSLLLIGLGIILDSIGKPEPTVQFIRVLQQIAIGYFIAFLVMKLGPVGQGVAVVALLAGHTFAFWQFEGQHDHAWDVQNKDNNFGRELDRQMHEPFDTLGQPNIMPLSTGFYVTFNAISSAGTILIGVLIGELLRSTWSPSRKAVVLALAGGLGLGLGLLLEITGLPHVKRLWTASFAIYAAGWTCWMMLFFYCTMDIIGWRGWAWPFTVVGVNSIFIYFIANSFKGTIEKMLQPFISEPSKVAISKALIEAEMDPAYVDKFTPIVMAVMVTFVLWLLCLFLYRRRIFFKV